MHFSSKYIIQFIGLTALFFNQLVFADSFGIKLNEEMAEFSISGDNQNLMEGSSGSLNFFYNEDKDYAGSLYLGVNGNPTGVGNFRLGIGAKFTGIYSDRLDDQFFALGIGGQASLTLKTTYPMSIVFEVNYAPDITTSKDMSSLIESTARIEVQIISKAKAFAGYRNYEFEHSKNNASTDYELDDNIHVGVLLEF
ncbi:MAG: hypothetical protein HON94_01385 [Methylococcales bacterium]|jgi:hypothetical protein|nr:hypothetical protein [Methylococcales bacterium]MBT7411354.1 hypothetical protein [Methylococcales bacterium]